MRRFQPFPREDAARFGVHPNTRDLRGHRQGRLVAVEPAGRAADGHILWRCRCDCGNEPVVAGHNLSRHNSRAGTKSCGCLRSEVSSRPKKAWNAGATYVLNDAQGRTYKTKHGWAKAARKLHGDACQVCGWDRARCDVHHIKPISKGGQHTLSNAIVVCPNCHREHHALRKPLLRHRSSNRGVGTARMEAARLRGDRQVP